MKRYGIVLAATFAFALALGAMARAPRNRAPKAALAAHVVTDSLRVTFANGTADPDVASVPEGRQLALTLVNGGAKAIAVGLAGYEDRVPAAPLAPGAERAITFVADRPGEAFAFLVDGEPCGRLAVTGSHLPEGHR